MKNVCVNVADKAENSILSLFLTEHWNKQSDVEDILDMCVIQNIFWDTDFLHMTLVLSV